MTNRESHVLPDAKCHDRVGTAEDGSRGTGFDSVKGFAKPKMSEREGLVPENCPLKSLSVIGPRNMRLCHWTDRPVARRELERTQPFLGYPLRLCRCNFQRLVLADTAHRRREAFGCHLDFGAGVEPTEADAQRACGV